MRELMVVALLCVALHGHARVELPASLHSDASDFKLLGSGRMTWYGLHVYDAALWSAAASPHARSPLDLSLPFALALRYSRDFDGGRIAQRSLAEIERLGFGTPEQRRRWLAAMRALFPDVRAGETLTGLYRPGDGAEFFHQDRRIGSIDDPDFARAFFSIWIDPRTRAPRLREQLMGIR